MKLQLELPEGTTIEAARILQKVIWRVCGIKFDIVQTKEKEKP